MSLIGDEPSHGRFAITMHNGARQMIQIGEKQWKIRCRLCGDRPRILASPKACHDWWRRHELKPRHVGAVASRKDRGKADREVAALFGEVWPNWSPGRQNPSASRQPQSSP
jgi:hypothetical protein